MKAYCERQGLSMRQIRFRFDGQPINETDTPAQAGVMGPSGWGPEDTCFEGGGFPAILSFPSDYPLSPPKMRFTCEMFHPNIYPDGRVCISILHAPGDDPMGYESSAERWSPVQSVEKILLSVVSMLAEPNDESGANVDASKMWREEREQFFKIAEQIVKKSLGL
ncbi:UNVERIFIED_CONTAM: hypothetical protein FKN15_044244 [Acipenser sinensis]